LSDQIPKPDFPKLKVITLLIIGLTTFGAAPILVRYATDVQPMVLAAMRTLFAVVILLPFWLPQKKSIRQLKDAGISTFMMMLAGFSLGLHFTFWVASLHYTSVASASVLVTIHPVMLIVAERFVFRKKFSGIVWFGVMIACMGSIVLGLSDHTAGEEFQNPLLGNILAFSAAVIFVLYFMIGRKLRQKAEWIDYVFHVYLHAAITCIILTFIWVGGWPYLSLSAILVGVALAVGPTIIGHGSMNYAVKYISPTILSTLVLSEGVIAAVAAYFIFNELPPALSIFAMAVIITGVGLSWIKRKEAAVKPESV
jgi:drug/metabolite transporter (DMT)-like permease